MRATRTSITRYAAAAAVVAVMGAVGIAPAHAVAPTAAPTLAAPSDGAVLSANPTLAWSAVAGAALYRVQVSAVATFSSTVYAADTVNRWATPPAELVNATFFWRVAAMDAAKALGPWSEVRTFRKQAGGAPTALSPSPGTIFNYPGGTPVLAWAPLTGMKSYKVEFADNSAMVGATPLATPNTAVAVSSALTFGKPYYWRVRGVTVAGQETAWTEASAFSVEWPQSAPALLTPAAFDTVDEVVLTWEAEKGAQHYLLEVSPNNDFTNNVIDAKSVLGTQYSPTATYPNGGYYWRVRPVDPLGRQGAWAEVRQFTRVSRSPSTPVLEVVPPGPTPALAWSPVPNGGVYEIQFDLDGNFGSGAIACTTFHSRFTSYNSSGRPSQPTGAPVYPANPPAPAKSDCSPAQGTWWWQVRALDTKPGATTGVFGPFSQPQQVAFGSPTALPGSLAPLASADYLLPAHCPPAAQCTPLSDTPLLKWVAAPGALSYNVRIALDPNFTNEVERYHVIGTELQPRESLADNNAGTAYYWWVQPCSDLQGTLCVPDDNASITSVARSFRKQAEPIELDSPVADAASLDVVTLDWSSSYNRDATATGAGSYRVQIAADATFATIVDTATVDQTEYQAVTKTYPDGRYYWRVQSVDSSGLGLAWSDYRAFDKGSSAPTNLALLRPTGAAVPYLKWASTDYVSGYLVQIYSGTSPTFPAASLVKQAVVKLPTYTPDVALLQGTYSWRVLRLDPSGNPGRWNASGTGAPPSFVVAAAAPSLSAPSSGAQIRGNAFIYSWTAVPGAAQYRLEASTSASFATSIEAPITVMTAWAPTKAYPDNVTVYWRVKALDSANNVLSTSVSRTFVKDAVAPTAKYDTAGTVSTLRPAVVVTFSEDVSNVTTSTVTLKKAGGTTVASAQTCATATPAAVACTSTSVRSVTVKPTANVVPGETYTVAVTTAVKDGFGNPAATSSVTFRALLTVEQNAGSAVLSAGWSTVTASVASGGSYAKALVTGSSATWVFKGASVRVGYIASPSSGKVGVYIDNVLKGTLDQYASGTVKASYSVGVPTGQHTLKLVALGTKSASSTGTAITLDSLTTS